ncbi:helix-turn-helix domain-containing protein [Streptomyces sp. NPDC006997]|uniref:helix-turn-helix domain-containing protein n=1 Tax=Streptomyces sp. NPDC006997 TaxID=3155356 RepID=UPI0033F2338C
MVPLLAIDMRGLDVLRNGRAKAVRFTTLAALCEALECQPGDLLRWEAEGEESSQAGGVGGQPVGVPGAAAYSSSDSGYRFDPGRAW